jgi:hypothetical protein
MLMIAPVQTILADAKTDEVPAKETEAAKVVVPVVIAKAEKADEEVKTPAEKQAARPSDKVPAQAPAPVPAPAPVANDTISTPDVPAELPAPPATGGDKVKERKGLFYWVFPGAILFIFFIIFWRRRKKKDEEK